MLSERGEIRVCWSLWGCRSERCPKGWNQEGSENMAWALMQRCMWWYVWSGEGGSEEPSSCPSDLRLSFSPVVSLTVCLCLDSFRNFPCAHNLCCLVSPSKRLSRYHFRLLRRRHFDVCYLLILFLVPQQICLNFSTSQWSKRDISRGMMRKALGEGGRQRSWMTGSC